MMIDMTSGVAVSMLTLISFLSGHDCAPIEGNTANIDPLGLLSEHNSQDDPFAAASDNQITNENAEIQKILTLSQADRNSESQMRNDYGVDLIDRDQLYSPYFFKKYLPKSSNNLGHPRILPGAPAIINAKRDGEIYSPYFLKRTVHAPQEFVGHDRSMLSSEIGRRLAKLHTSRRQFEDAGMFD